MKQITCIVENTAQRGTSFRSQHGLAFRFEMGDACALFDTGATSGTLLHNLGLLAEPPGGTSAAVLSHAHADHTGGLLAFLSRNPGLPLYASPDMFTPRFSLREGAYKDIGLPVTREQLTALADLRLNDAPVEVLPGLWTTGEINERPEPEGRSTRHYVPDGDGWQADPYRDDMSMVMETQEGLVVILGCCHAGLLNTLAHVRLTFGQDIATVIGGTHLAEADRAYLDHVAGVLRDTYRSPRLHLNHCTGERAFVALTNVFGNRVTTCPAGTVLTFE